MKKIRKIAIILLFILGIFLIGTGILYGYYSSPVGGSSDNIEVIVEDGSTSSQIGKILKEKDLIKNEFFYKIYLKINGINTLKAGTYSLNKEMSLGEIIDIISKGNNFNEEEISLTFQEGINMRKIASIIANGTNNTEEDVFNLLKDKEYLQSLINDYWFITDEILNDKLYYSLEGYLFPDTYRFNNKDVSVKEIFNKLLKKMDSVLTKNKEKIEKSKYNVHEILTLASIAEKEVGSNLEYRKNVISVFINRLNSKMSLGSDVTTRYSLKIDDGKRVLKKSEYNSVNDYNTRSSSLAGKLPVGPISTVSEMSIDAFLECPDTDYLYFIANIKSGETFFYHKSSDFEKKKKELSSVNNGL